MYRISAPETPEWYRVAIESIAAFRRAGCYSRSLNQEADDYEEIYEQAIVDFRRNQ